MTQAFFEQHYAVMFPVPFFALWAFVSFTVTTASGWRRLAKRFQQKSAWPSTTLKQRFCFISMGFGASMGGVTLTSSPVGLGMQQFPLFRLFFPPILVPWQEISIERSSGLPFFRKITLRLGREERVPVRISRRVAARLKIASQSSWPDTEDVLGLEAV